MLLRPFVSATNDREIVEAEVGVKGEIEIEIDTDNRDIERYRDREIDTNMKIDKNMEIGTDMEIDTDNRDRQR